MKELTQLEINYIHGGDIGLAFAATVLGGTVGAAMGIGAMVTIPAITCMMLNHTAEDCGYALKASGRDEELSKMAFVLGGALGAGIGVSAVGTIFSLLK